MDVEKWIVLSSNGKFADNIFFKESILFKLATKKTVVHALKCCKTNLLHEKWRTISRPINKKIAIFPLLKWQEDILCCISNLEPELD